MTGGVASFVLPRMAVASCCLVLGCAAQTIVDLLPSHSKKPDAAAADVGGGANATSDAAGTQPESSTLLPLDAAALRGLPPATFVNMDDAADLSTDCPGAVVKGPTIQALHFGGSSARVEIPSSSHLNLATEFAIEAWVLLCSTAGGPSIVSQYSLAVEDKFLGIDSARQVPEAWFYLGLEEMPILASTAPLSMGSWHHLAVSAGSGTLQLFVDGKSMATVSLLLPVANGSDTLYIGSSLRSGWIASIDGYIADVRISSFNRYPADFTPAPTLAVDSATLAFWPLDEGTGVLATDRGPAGLNGTIGGGASWESAPGR